MLQNWCTSDSRNSRHLAHFPVWRFLQIVTLRRPEAASLYRRMRTKCARIHENPHYLARLAAGSDAPLPWPVRDSCHATNMGAATAIDEYVPIRMPTTKANEKPL